MMNAPPALRTASARVRLPAVPEAASAARDRVRALLGPAAPEAVHAAVLVASELVANAVAAEPGQMVTLGLELRAGRLRIAVLDTSPLPPAAGEAAPGELTEAGRGLLLVAALACRWGWHRVPTGGKAVWADILIGAS